MAFERFLRVILVAVVLVAGTAEAGNSLVATVGGIPITKYELQRKLETVLPLQGSFHGGVSQERIVQIREESLEELIEQAYKVRYALSEEISVSNASVDEVIAPIRAQYESSASFEKAAGEEGINAFRASIYRQLLAQKAEEVAVDSKIQVTDEQVRKYYDDNKMSYMRPKQFKASHILIKVDPASNNEEREELKKRAEGLLERAKAEEDFYNLAYFNSDDRSKYVGGDLGYFHEGQTVKEFEDAMLQMKVGEVSDLVKTRWGYHIIKLVEVNEPRLLAFEEVGSKIRQSLEKQERDSIYADWMSGLKEQYKIERIAQ